MCNGWERSSIYVPEGLGQGGGRVGGVVGVAFSSFFQNVIFLGVHFENVENVTGVEILRQRIAIL